MFGILAEGIDLGTALTGAATSVTTQVGAALPVALPIGGSIIAVVIGWKLFKRPALRKATDMDLTSGLEEIDADEEYWKQNYQPPTTRWGKFVDWLL